jgi:hypothetical protein
MLKKILIGLIVVVALVLIIASRQPDTYSISRSVVVEAPQAKVFAQVNDFHNWQSWSPWAAMDPSMKTTFEGPSKGVGAVYGWSGNSKVGEGKMAITESKPNSLVGIKLDFLKPMKDTSAVEFSFAPEGKGTKATWTMSGNMNLIAKTMCLFTSMDKMIGPDFERGLAQLKATSEGKK